jgi:16S rRNA (cytosine1402-N4)-methyltransferase
MGPEVIDLLALRPGGFYLDGTVGGGGHTRLILDACGDCRVLAVDRDPEALAAARAALAEDRGRVRFLATRFDDAGSDPEVRDRGLDGALLDLGVSSHQLDADERGFAFRRGVTMDMRMNGAEGAGGAEGAQARP